VYISVDMNWQAIQEAFERGRATIDNAVPVVAAEEARAQFIGAEYELIDQVRERHYEHVFKTDSPYLPKPGEPYLARFRRSKTLESGAFLRPFYDTHIRPILGRLAGIRGEDADLRAYHMKDGDHQRIHIDDYAGPVGFIYYMSKGWKWDWGGLLMMAQGDEMVPSLPVFNRLVVLNHGKVRPPHMVTPVTPFAREPRYMLVGFAR
jgi:Rps23 Pro-64 3,4-dihydroxylase Tpa1-like proline 4-hydroxylase